MGGFSEKAAESSANLRAGFPSRAFEFRLLYIALQRILTIEIFLAASHAPGPLMLDNYGHSRTAGESQLGGRGSFLCMAGGAALVAACVVAVYWPCLHGGFILDDDKLVTDNDLVRSPEGLGRIWFSTQPQDYWPLTNSLFWLQWRMWGSSPIGYHATSLLLHVAAALLIWRSMPHPEYSSRILGGAFVRRSPGECAIGGLDFRAEEYPGDGVFLVVGFLVSAGRRGTRGQRRGASFGEVVLAEPGDISAGDAKQRLGSRLAVGAAANYLVAAQADRQERFVADCTIFRRRHRSYGRQFLVYDAWRRHRRSRRHIWSTSRWRRRRGVVLPIEGARAHRFGIYLSAVANTGEQNSLVVAGAGRSGSYGGAVVEAQFAAGRLDATLVVRLDIFLRGIVAGFGICGRWIYGVFASGRSLPAFGPHRRDSGRGGRLERLAFQGTRVAASRD